MFYTSIFLLKIAPTFSKPFLSRISSKKTGTAESHITASEIPIALILLIASLRRIPPRPIPRYSGNTFSSEITAIPGLTLVLCIVTKPALFPAMDWAFNARISREYNSQCFSSKAVKTFSNPGEISKKGKKEFVPQKLENHEVDLEARQEKLRKMMEKMQRVLSKEKIENYVLDQLQDRPQMMASQLPLASAEDFVKIIYIRLYRQRKKLKYYVEPEEIIEAGGYRFRDFRIGRK